MLALYAGALDERVRRVALRQTITDYRSLAVAERYSQPFGIYAYGLLKEFDLPQVASALGPRPVMFVNLSHPGGRASGAGAGAVRHGAEHVLSDTGRQDGPCSTVGDWLASGT